MVMANQLTNYISIIMPIILVYKILNLEVGKERIRGDRTAYSGEVENLVERIPIEPITS
jgi:hypothetical protein